MQWTNDLQPSRQRAILSTPLCVAAPHCGALWPLWVGGTLAVLCCLLWKQKPIKLASNSQSWLQNRNQSHWSAIKSERSAKETNAKHTNTKKQKKKRTDRTGGRRRKTKTRKSEGNKIQKRSKWTAERTNEQWTMSGKRMQWRRASACRERTGRGAQQGQPRDTEDSPRCTRMLKYYWEQQLVSISCFKLSSSSSSSKTQIKTIDGNHRGTHTYCRGKFEEREGGGWGGGLLTSNTTPSRAGWEIFFRLLWFNLGALSARLRPSDWFDVLLSALLSIEWFEDLWLISSAERSISTFEALLPMFPCRGTPLSDSTL